MKINKWIYSGPTFKVNSEVICKAIDTIMPEQELINTNAKFIHKMMNSRNCESLHENIARPNRSTSIYFHRRPKKKLYRTALEHHIDCYNQIPAEMKYIKLKAFSSKLQKAEIEYKPCD